MQVDNVKKIILIFVLIFWSNLHSASVSTSVLSAGEYALRGVVMVDEGMLTQGYIARYKIKENANKTNPLFKVLGDELSGATLFQFNKTANTFCAVLRRDQLAKSCSVIKSKGKLYQHEIILETSSRQIAALGRQGVIVNQVLGAPNTIIATAGDDLAADAAVILISKDGVLVSKPSGEYQVLGLSTGNRSRLFKQGL